METAILRDIEGFLVELGSDFAFLARQKRIVVDGEDFYLDLLFYHRRLAKRGIRVSEYLTELPPKKVLEQKLHDAVRLAQARLRTDKLS